MTTEVKSFDDMMEIVMSWPEERRVQNVIESSIDPAIKQEILSILQKRSPVESAMATDGDIDDIKGGF